MPDSATSSSEASATTGAPSRPYLRRHEASAYLARVWGIRRATQTLAKDAVTGRGPRYRLAARTPLYHPDALDAWAASILDGSEEPQRRTPPTGGPRA